jgi:hypothetical protein
MGGLFSVIARSPLLYGWYKLSNRNCACAAVSVMLRYGSRFIYDFCRILVSAYEFVLPIMLFLGGRERPLTFVTVGDYFFFKFLAVGWDWVHLLRRPLIGLLYQPRMIDDAEYGAVGGMRIGRGNRSSRRKPAPVPLCQPQTHMTWAGIEPGPPQWKDGD